MSQRWLLMWEGTTLFQQTLLLSHTWGKYCCIFTSFIPFFNMKPWLRRVFDSGKCLQSKASIGAMWNYFPCYQRLCSSANGSEQYRTIPYRADPLRTMSGWFCRKRTKVYLRGTHSAGFAPYSCVQHVAYQWGTVRVCIQVLIKLRYGSLWHAVDHIRNWSTAAPVQTNSLRVTFALKPMDSFGTWRKWKLTYFLLMQNFIELYELLTPC